MLTEGNLFCLLRSHFSISSRCKQTEFSLNNFSHPKTVFLLSYSLHDDTLIFSQIYTCKAESVQCFVELCFLRTRRCVSLSGSQRQSHLACLASPAILYRHRGFGFSTRCRKCLVEFSTSWPITKRTLRAARRGVSAIILDIAKVLAEL